MWIKKLFQKEKGSKQEKQQAITEFEQQNMEESCIFVDQSLDLRYADIKIIKASKNLNIPLSLLHFTQSVAFHEQDVIQAKSQHNSEWCKINLILTDRQIIISPDIFAYAHQQHYNKTNTLVIPLGIVEKVDRIQVKKEQTKLQFTMKDSRVFLFRSILTDYLIEIEKIVKMFAFPQGVNKIYAFKYAKSNHKFILVSKEKKCNGWELYSFRKEMERQGVIRAYSNVDKNWQILPVYKLIDNSKGQLSSTYPLEFIVPKKMSEVDLVKCSKFRTKERLPCLTYFYQYKFKNFVSLFRCSQNKIGLMSSRCFEDQKMIAYVSEATEKLSQKPKILAPKFNVKIYDARGYYAALGNKLAGKGFENEEYYNCEIQFLNIPNIHAVRDSYNKVKNYNPHTQEFIQVIAESGWYQFLFLILSGAKSVAKTLKSGTNVVVHCSDGWDRTAQLCSLGQLLLDPYFRTLEGFVVLVEKDWRHFGHKFRERTGQFHPTKYSSHEISPVFIQFLDCIYQIMHQFPLTFEFNYKLLNFLAEATQNYTYGNFITNNIQEAKLIKLQQNTVSVWSDVMENKQSFMNKLYDATLNASVQFLDISIELKDVLIWKEHLIAELTTNSTEQFVIQKELEVNKRLKDQVLENNKVLEQLKKQLHIKQ